MIENYPLPETVYVMKKRGEWPLYISETPDHWASNVINASDRAEVFECKLEVVSKLHYERPPTKGTWTRKDGSVVGEKPKSLREISEELGMPDPDTMEGNNE